MDFVVCVVFWRLRSFCFCCKVSVLEFVVEIMEIVEFVEIVVFCIGICELFIWSIFYLECFCCLGEFSFWIIFIG